MEMTVDEILYSYRSAKDKAEQVKILAELNLCKICDIEKLLVENGEQVPDRKTRTRRKDVAKRNYAAWDEQSVAQLKAYVREGLSNLDIAERLGRPLSSIEYQISKRGFARLRGKEECVEAGGCGGSQANLQKEGDVDDAYMQYLEQEFKSAVFSRDEYKKQLEEKTLEFEALRLEKEGFEKQAEALADENRQLTETFSVDMDRATSEVLILRQELDAVRNEKREASMNVNNAVSMLHLILTAVKGVQRQSDPIDDAVLRGVAVGLANAIVLMNE